ncbi:MAG: hypothetical protein J7507_16060, partial [Pseudoxanthomonas sp.]|nr:hypothetical protein [Pseudoxanthomonas sp.]
GARPGASSPWARHLERVLATLAFSTAAQSLRLDSFDLQRFTEYEDELLQGAAWSAPATH